MKKVTISSLLISMLACTSVQAFDEQREGFVISLGAGLSSIKTEVEVGGYGADETSLGLATSFKIGYGFTNQFLLYYINDVSWFGYDNDPNDDTYASSITGVGVSYYLEEKRPIYVMGALGLGRYINVTENASESGSALLLGVGYEVSPHFQVEATYLSNSIEEDGVELDTGAVRVTLNYMWY